MASVMTTPAAQEAYHAYYYSSTESWHSTGYTQYVSPSSLQKITKPPNWFDTLDISTFVYAVKRAI